MKKKPTEERKPTKPTLSRWQSFKRLGVIFLMGGSLLCTLTAAVVIGVYSHLAKAYDLTKLGDMPERTIVMDYKGEVLGGVPREEVTTNVNA